MQTVFHRLAASAPSDLGVLITGPSGSGKSLAARILHHHSPRAAGPFLAVDCSSLSETAAEADLFGTPARPGLIAGAGGGTLVLEEVGDLPPPAQARLLGCLGGEIAQAGIRVVATSGRPLDRLVAGGALREDLAWRLRVVAIDLPPLRERLDDLPALVRHLLGAIARRCGRTLAITDAALVRLRGHHWPGNIRELRHRLEEAVLLAGSGAIAPEHLDLPVGEGAATDPGRLAALLQAEAGRLLAERPGEAHRLLVELAESAAIRAALARTGGNQLRAAEALGINRTTLKKRIDETGHP